MWSEARQESPLIGLQQVRQVTAQGVPDVFHMAERPFLELVNLRGDANDSAFTQAIRQTLGVAPPTEPNTIAAGNDCSLLWLGPDEWLVKSDAPRKPVLEAKLRTLLTGRFAAVTDVSSGYTVLELSGSRVRNALQKGCPLDLHPHVFKVGQCAQSHFFKADVLLWPQESGAWGAVVRRSFADYAGRMLLDAAQEFFA